MKKLVCKKLEKEFESYCKNGRRCMSKFVLCSTCALKWVVKRINKQLKKDSDRRMKLISETLF